MVTQLASNDIFKSTNPLTCVDYNYLSYLIVWKIEEILYRNDKTIESDINTIVIIIIIVIGHYVASFLNSRAHSEYFYVALRSHTYITFSIYISYFTLFF